MKKLSLLLLSTFLATNAFASYDCTMTYTEPVVVKRIHIEAPLGTYIDLDNIPSAYITKIDEVNPALQGKATSSGMREQNGKTVGTIEVTTKLLTKKPLTITDKCNADIYQGSGGKRCVLDLKFNGRTNWTAMFMQNSQDREDGMNMLMAIFGAEEIDGELKVEVSGSKMRTLTDKSAHASAEVYLPLGISKIKLSSSSDVNNFGFYVNLECTKI